MDTANLKQARRKRTLTQKEVADKIGVGQSTYKNYECGLREPNNELLCKIANLFNVTTDYLLGRDSEFEPFEALKSQYDLSDYEMSMIMFFVNMRKEERNALTNLLKQAGHSFSFHRNIDDTTKKND